MLAGLLFTAAGFACGFILRLGGFAFGVAVLSAGYGLLLWWTGASLKALAVELLLALVFLQIGYVAFVIARVLLAKLKARWPGFGRLHSSLHFLRTGKTDHSTR
ncbi:hypothetical protein GWE18_35010 [Bradyrhizobium sp. CSA112]|jgi:hypothetical protein|uniref:hypothetical protein n=1 Tax=Bradyrhizobium sp. CSA112 TaxID=2699170 RepID=UPI0023AF841A|nr:hypothetical protein [Bradyrhizobium sp. CSA112]MDE5457932.1 hypothetical protein [Bradyrhizobium sp. CSA112]